MLCYDLQLTSDTLLYRNNLLITFFSKFITAVPYNITTIKSSEPT